MYEDFHVTDRWTGRSLHCLWKANIVAIATRHADSIDVRFLVDDRVVTLALPSAAWVEQKQRTGLTIPDPLAAQIAGRFLKQLIEQGLEPSRQLYTLTVPQVLEQLEAVVDEARQQGSLPTLPVLD